MKTNLQHVLDIYRTNAAVNGLARHLQLCVVRDYGTANECLLGNFSTWRNAMNWIERNSTDDDSHRLEIFQYTADIELTKEFTK